jgi:hypothetical protein
VEKMDFKYSVISKSVAMIIEIPFEIIEEMHFSPLLKQLKN